MNPYKKGATLLLRLIAVGLILIGGFNFVLELLRHRAQHVEISVVKIVVNSLVSIAGAALFAFSSKLAARLTDSDDE